MRQLFDEEGMRRLDAIVQPGMLCVFDFDGTLSPIVVQPDSAALPPEVRERLVTLTTLAAVAILTGRSLTDIRKRLGFEPHYVIGNHGLEGVPGRASRRSRYAADCATWRQALDVPADGLLALGKGEAAAYLHGLERVVPFVWRVGEAIPVSDDAEAARRLAAPDFDPLSTGLIHGDAEALPPGGDERVAFPHPSGLGTRPADHGRDGITGRQARDDKDQGHAEPDREQKHAQALNQILFRQAAHCHSILA